MPHTTPDIWTSGAIARELGVRLSTVRHHLEDVEPLGRVGIIRTYDATALERVRQRLRHAAERRGEIPH